MNSYSLKLFKLRVYHNGSIVNSKIEKLKNIRNIVKDWLKSG